jgi:hypothetical protein
VRGFSTCRAARGEDTIKSLRNLADKLEAEGNAVGNFHESWRDYKPPAPGTRTIAGQDPDQDQAAAKKKLDRGSRRGARRCVVANGTLYELAVARQLGIKGENFQSLKEAKRWISLLEEQRCGAIRNLRRQVRFSLQARGPHGLMEHVAFYVADFTYEESREVLASVAIHGEPGTVERWEEVVEDVKPGVAGKGSFREDTFLLKRRWFQVQFGKAIRET